MEENLLKYTFQFKYTFHFNEIYFLHILYTKQNDCKYDAV